MVSHGSILHPIIQGTPQVTLLGQLRRFWQFQNFRHGQEEVIKAVLEHHDTLVVMPTGAGKSLCYQLPAIMLPGLTLVVSPLIALMKDQVEALTARGISAAYINSSLTPAQNAYTMHHVRQGKIRILYVAPERFPSEEFGEMLKTIPIALFAIDEAHCVSQWGHDFRPDYMNLKRFIAALPRRPTVLACTATATPEVQDDVVTRLGLKTPQVFVRGFDRPNLTFLAARGLDEYDREKLLVHAVSSLQGAGIVYAGTRKRTEELAVLLQDYDIAASVYHAGMKPEERKSVQDAFMADRIRVMVATVAFGMGIDKKDIRFVLHAHMPSSLESYYQEAGRAGRDGRPALCMLLHAYKDRRLHEYFIEKALEEMLDRGKPKHEAHQYAALRSARLDTMHRYATRSTCRRRQILHYFGDPESKTVVCDVGCDVCLAWLPTHPIPIL